MQILFTHSYFYQLDEKQWRTAQPYPPLGTIYAASLLRESGYSVGLFDVGLQENEAGLVPILDKAPPQLLVIYDDGFNYLTKMCLTNMREAAFRMAKEAQKRGLWVVVCSSDATDRYELYLDNGIDFVIQGEGEITLLHLSELLSRHPDKQRMFEEANTLSTIEGIIYRHLNTTHKNPKRAVLKDLDSLPQAAWDLVDIDSYRKIWMEKQGYFSLNIATTRGCPYKCNWCAKPIYGNRYNSRSPQKVVDEIAFLLRTYQPSHFWMCDDIFGLTPQWVQQFRDCVKQNGLAFKYKIQSRADLLLQSDNLKALAESGLETVWIGAESGSQKILDAMDKGITLAQIQQATHLLKEHKIRIAFFLQFGYLGETQEDIQATLDMVRDLLPDDIGISVSYPLPGTKFYDKVKDDLKAKTNWTDSNDLDMMFQNTFPPEFYKVLHRFVHIIYRKKQGIQQLKAGILPLTFHSLRAVAAIPYYTIAERQYAQKLKRWAILH